ncbi:MAG: hypothetical protein ACJA2W_002342, partial [Planctomycetota bacterium]
PAASQVAQAHPRPSSGSAPQPVRGDAAAQGLPTLRGLRATRFQRATTGDAEVVGVVPWKAWTSWSSTNRDAKGSDGRIRTLSRGRLHYRTQPRNLRPPEAEHRGSIPQERRSAAAPSEEDAGPLDTRTAPRTFLGRCGAPRYKNSAPHLPGKVRGAAVESARPF